MSHFSSKILFILEVLYKIIEQKALTFAPSQLTSEGNLFKKVVITFLIYGYHVS